MKLPWLASLLSVYVTAAEPARLYLANEEHTDYMWTADAATYDQVFVDLLDFHLELADATAGNPSPYRNRFNADGSYWLWNYERKKSPSDFARLITRLKDGTISAPLNTLVSCYGGQPLEGALRGLYYAGRLERRHDLRFRLASATENQTLPRGLASVFAGSGAPYTWRGVCGCASRLPNEGVLSARPHEVYWHAGPDGRRQLMKWYSLGPYNIGGYWEAGSPEKAAEWVATNEGFLKRHVNPATGQPYRVVGLFGFGGDDLARKTGQPPPAEIPAQPGFAKIIASPYSDHFHVIAQRLTTPDRQVIVSNELDYFADFERTYGASLPSLSLTYGNEWDLYSASMAETSAQVRRAVEKLRSAEALSIYATLGYPAFLTAYTEDRDRAFADLGLYWEHDWTADGHVSRERRAAWQQLLATRIEFYVDSLQAEGLLRLGGQIPRPSPEVHRFFVFNPLGWPRDDVTDYRYRGPTDIHVHDLVLGRDVPHQFVRKEGATFLRILATDVPAVGYKVYEIRPGPGSAPTDPAATFESDRLANAQVRLRLARDGALTSLVPLLPGGRELAAEVDGLHLNDFAAASDDGEALAVVESGPVSVTIRARTTAGLPRTTEITLHRGSDRVEIVNRIEANFGDIRHWVFSFDLEEPRVHTEEIGAINLNRLASDGGHYADTHARYDYITVNHFADISSTANDRGITLSNADLAFAKLGRSTPQQLDTATPQLSVLAGGQVDGRNLGIRDQNGATRFLQRFALRAHQGYDPAKAMRFALEHQNPLLAAPVISRNGPTAFPEHQHSLVTVTGDAALLWALKPAEEGLEHGLIARLWNVTDAPATAQIALPSGLASARLTTHIETDLEDAPLRAGQLEATFAPQQIQTYRLLPAIP